MKNDCNDLMVKGNLPYNYILHYESGQDCLEIIPASIIASSVEGWNL
jgi:hypothetical protein